MKLFGRIVQRLLYKLYLQRVAVLLVLVLVVAGADYLLWRSSATSDVEAADSLPVEVAISDLRQQGQSITLTLKEKNGSRRVAMNLGQAEALVIARERGQAQKTPDQLAAYDLMRDVIQQMGGRVDRVVVNDANAQQYFAQIVVSTDGAQKVIGAKPADALALAIKAGAPIFVEDRVLEQYGLRGTS